MADPEILFKVVEIPRPRMTGYGDRLWTVIRFVDGNVEGGDHHWVRERYARRAQQLYNRYPQSHGVTESILATLYREEFGSAMFDPDPNEEQPDAPDTHTRT